MKRILGVLLSLLLLLSLFTATAFAAEENDISKFELPAPKAPNYFVILYTVPVRRKIWLTMMK